MDLGLVGKRALVVGGSRGIGYATAEALAAEGATIVSAARTRGALDNARGRLLRHGRTVLAIPADTSQCGTWF
jgi:3-oxoacyl-[acyl-carrier protein] reductase